MGSGTGRSRWGVAAVSALSLALSAGACNGDDDTTSSSGATGGSTAAKGGKGGTAGKGGTSGKGGSAGMATGGSSAGSDEGVTGGRGGTSGRGGTGNNGGKAGSTSNRGGTSGEAGQVSMGGTGTGQAGEPAASGSGGEATLIDPTDFDGKKVFRYDTFGDEQFWTDTLRLNEAIQAALDPTTALGLGLKVDSDALPEGILDTADLTDPATTVALIKLDAVLGVKGTVDAEGNLTRVGVTCALCHSSVDDSVMPGIGKRIDGAANRQLDPGAIIALAPGLASNQEALDVYNSWGPGFYDPRYNQDGINHPVVIPPAYGLKDVPLETYTGDGPVSYWNAYVAVTQMHGIGTFFDPRIDVAVIYDQDLVTPKLPSLFDYQMTLEPPEVPSSAFDADAAERGDALFNGDTAKCGSCHEGDRYTDAEHRLHSPAEVDQEPITAQRSATGLYRTTPLRALLAHPPYFHDGSAATLADVVNHYDTAMSLDLTAEQKSDLVEYLKSL